LSDRLRRGVKGRGEPREHIMEYKEALTKNGFTQGKFNKKNNLGVRGKFGDIVL